MTVEFVTNGTEWTLTWTRVGVTLRGTDPGPWRTEPGSGPGGEGRWFRGTEMDVHVPTSGAVVTAIGRTRDSGRILALDAVADLTVPASRLARLVNGYQSWDYAGVRPADEPGHTWWGGALAAGEGPGLAFHAATAHRLATSFETAPAGSGVRLRGRAGGSPTLTPNPPSWGFFPSAATELALDRVGAAESEPVLLTADADPLEAVERVAELTGRVSGALAWDGPSILGWESWYHYGFSILPETLLANGRLMRERFPDQFRVLQLDDGWQRSYGDWEPATDRWPEDLGVLTAEMRALDCIPGLWLAPFMVWPDGSGLGQRKEWLLRDPADESLVLDPLMGRHGLDATHPDALQYLHDLGARVRRWGFEMVKLDFLYIGAQEAARHEPGATGTEALRRGLAAFTDGLGPDVYVLGCGMPLLPAVGLCHGNRIGGDLAAPLIWPFPELTPFDPDDGWAGVLPQARNAAARWFTHRRLFHNDPDVVMAAGPAQGPPYAVSEAGALAALAALCGGPFFLADDLASLPPEKRAVLEDGRVVDLAWSEGFRPIDLFARVDTAERPDFFTPPTALASDWKSLDPVRAQRAHFDWYDRRRVDWR